MGEAASFHDGLLDDSAILRTALSLVSSRRSRFKRSCPSFSSSLWKVVLRVVNPISTGITASVPKVSLKGVYFVGVLTVVRYAHNTLGSSSTHILFAPSSWVLICLRLIRMLMWHHGGMIRGTWHVLAACWRALDGCQHIQARGEHMKTREKEGRHSAGAWKRVTRKVFIPTRLGRLRVDGKVVTPAARGKEGLLSDGAWKSVTTLMMKISPGVDRSGDDLHRSGVCFPSLKRLRVDRKVVTSAARGKEGLLSDGAWKSVTTLMMKISPGASQELKLLENQLTAIKRAEERKTCKRQESDRSGHRFGAGLGGSDAFWPARAWCWVTLRGLHPQDSRRTPVHDEVLICPCDVAQYHAQAGHYLPDEGSQTLHASQDPTKFTFKVFLGINTDKGVGAPLAGPKPVPIPTSCYSFAGLPFLGTKEGRLLIFQQYHFLAGCATVDMKMQTSVISMEMQISDINSTPTKPIAQMDAVHCQALRHLLRRPPVPPPGVLLRPPPPEGEPRVGERYGGGGGLDKTLGGALRSRTGNGLPNGGSPAHHVSSDLTEPRRPRGLTRRTRSMEIHAQALPSSSQPPEVAAMERQVRDLTANLQELTRQNQVLNQRLLQHEIEKQKKKDKGKSKERGDAESRQERQQEQRQEQQEQQQEQRQEQEGETKGENTRITVEQSSAKWEQEIKAMRAQMGEMKDEFKGRATKNIDDIVQGTDSPFTKTVISFPLPSKFRMPSLEIFDGSKDPLDHLESFKTVMCLQGVPDEIMCRSFAQLSRLFFNHFIGGQRYGRPTTHLLNVKQKEGETLRSYLTRFNKETLLVDGADDKVVLTAFISGLQSGDFLFSVYKDPPSTMTEMMYEAQRYMNGEEALLARDQTTGKKRKGDHADRPAEPHETRPKAQRNRNRRQEDRSGRGFNERFNRFTPLNALVDHIFMQIRNDPALKWPGKLLTDPDKRPRDKYCRFHRDHGHNTEDCYDLKRQIEELIKQGKLQRFIEKGQREGRPQGARQHRPPGEAPPRPPLGEIHVITGGMAAGGTSRSSRKAYARQIHNVLVTQKSNKKPRVEDLPITFTEEDACKVFHPHDDALVVTMEIAGYSTRRVLIDNGSSADIIYLTAFQQMKIDKDQLQPIETPLVGFAGTSIYPLGMVTLQIIAGTHPKQAIKKVNFLVVDCPSAYNVIIGRPTLNRLRAVTSTYHLLVRFPTENGIGEMKGDQAMARECYLTTVNAEQVHQTLIVEERQNIAEPTEELEEIVLIEGDEKKTTRIGTSMAKEIRASVVSFLRGNADVFAWSHDDMPGISTEVISHKLNVNPSTPPVRQKRRVFAPERNTAVMEEVDKLLKAGFIREVYYPEMARQCDQLVDSTAGHKLLSFMDAFSGYNQIQMTEVDQEKTAFITSRGLFYYKVMPFGLKNAGATYQRLVNKMFHDQIGRNMEVYVDDMLVKSKKDEDHLIDLKETFQTLRRYNMKLNPAKCVFGVSSGKFLGFMVSQRGIEANPDKIKAILDMSPPKTVKEVQSLTGKAAALNRFVSRSTDKCLPFFRTLRKAFQWTEECQKAFEELKAYLSSPPLLSPFPDRKAMNKPDAAGRLVQWSIEMSEFHIDYRPRTAIKAQALADFIAEFTQPWKDEEELEEGEAWTVNIDGSSTKEMSGAGVVLVSPEKEQIRVGVFRSGNRWLRRNPRKTVYRGRNNKSYLIHYDVDVAHNPIPQRRDPFLQIGQKHTNFEYVLLASSCWGSILYKMGFSRPHLRCLSPEEANYVIREVHEGVCGNHSGARSLAHKLTRAGYYWPSLLHDATQFVKACDKCQALRQCPEGATGGIHAHNLTMAFRTMGARYYGRNPWQQFQKRMSSLSSGRPSFCRFGIPRVLISDNGKQFDNGPFRELCAQLNIKNHYSSPRHPQANGQVEVTNRTLLKQIKTRLEGAKSMWVEELPSVLWAYRTTVRTPTKETPFKLTFGTEAVIPVEIGLTTLRTTFHKEGENEGQLRLNLDLLDEIRERAARRIALYQGKMARYYNAKVKLRRFEVGDWVLRKVTQATKDPSQGKLGPNWEGPYKIIQYYRRGTYHLEDRHGKKLPHPWNAEHLKKYYP
uniref:Integrase catalytic domain-containing protein n=1 Tax=Fagus sylvatica TaxID=28930 RepID=A0A2N9F125_FAGSY